MDDKGITIKFKAETVTFKKDVAQINFALSALRKEASSINSELKFDGVNTEKLKRKLENLQGQETLLVEKATQWEDKMRQIIDLATKENRSFTDKEAKALAEASKNANETANALRAVKKQIGEVEGQLKYFTGDFSDAMYEAAEVANIAASKFDELSKKTEKISELSYKVLKEVTTQASEYESAFAGVKKTVEGTEEDYENISEAIIDLSKNLPITAVELAGIAEAAGQLGVKKDDISKFAEVMAKLGISTNLSGEEAATAIARIYNIMGADLSDVDKFGATLTDLGNNTAATESEILSLATRLASAAHQVGFTQSEVLGLSSALAGVGLEAEAGGSALSKTLVSIDKAVAEYDEELAKRAKKYGANSWAVKDFKKSAANPLLEWAKITGKSFDDFSKQWKESAKNTFVDVVNGLANSTDNLNIDLEKLGITALRQSDAMRRLAGNSELLQDSVDMAAKAWEENSALEVEVSKRNDTYAAKMQEFKNAITEVAIKLGETLLPILEDIIEYARKVVDWFAGLPEPLQELIVKMLIFGTALSPAFKALKNISLLSKNIFIGAGKWLPKIVNLVKFIAGYLIGPGGLCAALIALPIVLNALYKYCEPFKKFVDGLVNKFKEMTNWLGGVWDWIKKIGTLKVKPEIEVATTERFVGEKYGNKHLPNMIIDSGGFGTLNLTTQIHVNNNGQPINESEIRRWGDTITDIVSVNLGKRLA